MLELSTFAEVGPDSDDRNDAGDVVDGGARQLRVVNFRHRFGHQKDTLFATVTTTLIGDALSSVYAAQLAYCTQREFIDYKTSMITDEDPLRGWLFTRISISLTHYTLYSAGRAAYRCQLNMAASTGVPRS